MDIRSCTISTSSSLLSYCCCCFRGGVIFCVERCGVVMQVGRSGGAGVLYPHRLTHTHAERACIVYHPTSRYPNNIPNVHHTRTDDFIVSTSAMNQGHCIRTSHDASVYRLSSRTLINIPKLGDSNTGTTASRTSSWTRRVQNNMGIARTANRALIVRRPIPI